MAKQACRHRIRAHYIRMPDLEEAWRMARDKPTGAAKFLRKYASFTMLVIDEWLLDKLNIRFVGVHRSRVWGPARAARVSGLRGR